MQVVNGNTKSFTDTDKEIKIIFIWKRKLKFHRDFLDLLNWLFFIGQGKKKKVIFLQECKFTFLSEKHLVLLIENPEKVHMFLLNDF